MKVFIIGVSGAVGGLLAQALRRRGVDVRGLVRRADQRRELAQSGIDAQLADLATMSVESLAAALDGVDDVVFTAGSNGGPRADTDAIDAHAVRTAIDAAQRARVGRFTLVSVMPESWRERELGDEVEHYFSVKKRAEVELTRSGLDWLILRPSLLIDDLGTGAVSLGPAEIHHQISRTDAADTLAELLIEPRARRRILELDAGTVPISEAVSSCIRNW